MTMTEPRRLIEIGVFPSGAEIFFEGNVDPAAVAIREGIARADRARAEAEAARLAAISDAERMRPPDRLERRVASSGR